MGGAKRYPSIVVCEDDGFRGAQPILLAAPIGFFIEEQVARMSAAICGINKAKTRGSRSPSSGAHSRDPLAHPGYACSEYPKIVFNNLGKRALMSASRTTLRCSTPFFEVWINPASRRMRKWFDSVDLAMSGHGAAAVHDMQSFFSSR